MGVKALLLAGLLSLGIPAQAGNLVLSNFCGIVNNDDAAVIPECAAKDALNVESSPSGRSLRRRDGTETYLDVGNGPPTGLFTWRAANGSECQIISDNQGNLYRSVNGLAAVKQTTITATASIFCSANDGVAYCYTSSNDDPMKDDCTTFTFPTRSVGGYINGKFNVFTQDRQLIAGSTTQANRVYVSKSGDVEDFIAGSDDIDPFTEDVGRAGDKITAMWFVNGRVVVGKENSVGAFLDLDDQFDAPYYDITNTVGVRDPSAGIVIDGVLYFKGSDNEIYMASGAPGDIKKISIPIENTIASLLSGDRRNIIQTTQSDWNAGDVNAAGPGAPANTSFVPGSVVMSSLTLVDISSADFSLGTLTNVAETDTAGLVSLSSDSLRDNWDDLNYTSGVVWTREAGSGDASRGFISGIFPPSNEDTTFSTTELQVSTGKWSFEFFPGIGSDGNCGSDVSGTCVRFDFVENAGGNHYYLEVYLDPGGLFEDFGKNIEGSDTVLARSLGNINQDTWNDISIERDGDGETILYINDIFISSFTDTAISSSTKMSFRLGSSVDGADNRVDNLFAYAYKPEGDIISRIFDTTFSTPTSGTMSSTFTALPGSEGGVFFDARSSTSPNNDLWSAWGASSDTLNLPNLNEQYWQYRARFNTVIASKTPTMDDISLLAGTTGQYVTACLEIGGEITSWGNLDLVGEFNDEASFTVEDSTGTSCTDTGLGDTWTATSTGSAISIVTAEAYKVRVTFDFASATETARMESLTVNWLEGSVASASYMAHWDDSLYVAVSTESGGNNRLLKYDLRTASWWVHDVGMTAPSVFNNTFYFGSTHAAKVMKFSDLERSKAPTSDDGVSITSYWKGKDFNTRDPFIEADLVSASLIAAKNDGGDFTIRWNTNGGDTASGSYNVVTSTGQNVVRSNYRFPHGTVGAFWSYEIEDTGIIPWEVLGIRFDFMEKPWRPLP